MIRAGDYVQHKSIKTPPLLVHEVAPNGATIRIVFHDKLVWVMATNYEVVA